MALVVVHCSIATVTAAEEPHGGHRRGYLAGEDLPYEIVGGNPRKSLDAHRMADLVLPEGYPLGEHHVITQDGYILRVFRLSKDSGESKGADNRPVVLLWHGLLDSSATWVLNGRSKSLGFILADAGFDVWMGNSRGNTYARQHMKLDADSKLFWNFTYIEMALHDLPATVDYILHVTGKEKLAYVGHSQGTLMGFVGFSYYKALARKISVAVMMAPVAFVTHMSSPPLAYLASFSSIDLLYTMGGKDFFSAVPGYATDIFASLCDSHPMVCKNAYMGIVGYNPKNLNGSRWDYYFEYTPAGTSAKNIVLWAQDVNREAPKTIMRYDYGTECKRLWFWERPCNQNIYGSEVPPQYKLDDYKVPTAVFWGGQDLLSNSTDVENLIDVLPADAIVYKKYNKNYEHVDYTWGIDAHVKIYPSVVELIRKWHALDAANYYHRL